MTNFTPEMIEKAKAAKTVEELVALAKANNVELTEDEAKTYFAQLNPATGELSDDELDNVAGGGCGGDDSSPQTRIYPPHTYTNGGTVRCGNAGCWAITGSNCESGGNGFCGTIHFLDNDKWQIVCSTCGVTIEGSGHPGDGARRHKFYP